MNQRIRVIEVAHHRNGISGTPFYVVRFQRLTAPVTPEEMVATVFPESGAVAVLSVPLLTNGVIGFGVNSWRGDEYEPALREAVRKYEATGVPV